jgi:hypothetical protein
MNWLDKIIVDAAFAALIRNRRAIVAASVCSGRIHDSEAAKVADINAMFTATEENEVSYQHLPPCMGGQERSNAEIESWGETLVSAMTIFGVGVLVAVVMFVAAIVAKGVV